MVPRCLATNSCPRCGRGARAVCAWCNNSHIEATSACKAEGWALSQGQADCFYIRGLRRTRGAPEVSPIGSFLGEGAG